MTVKTLKEAEDRIRKAMEPPADQAGQNFAPGIERIRRAAGQSRPAPARRQLPTAR